MQIPLSEFEQIIDEQILKRGLTYFKGGAITDFSEISLGEYEATVSGTEEYTIQLEVKDNVITKYNCDCPYDMGAVCKHVVAAIFHLQQDVLELNQPSISKSRKKKTKSVSQQVKELLKEISHKELIAFVQENSEKDKKFRNSFLASFGHLSQNQSKEFYQKQIIDGEYERERAQLFKLDLLKRFKSEKEVESYINKHISNSSIRKQEIEKEFITKNFERAIELSKDGIKYDEKEKPGLAKDWYDWLLKIALVQNDTTKIIEYARYRLINNFGGTQDYYQILKDTIEEEKWHSFLEEIIEEATPKNKWKYSDLIRKIYIKEEWWDRLFMMLKENLSMENIQQNEQYLSKDYSSELIELYSERITNYVEKFVGRNHYQTACRYLRRMKKLGGDEQVNELIALFRKQYPQRKALMDKLSRV